MSPGEQTAVSGNLTDILEILVLGASRSPAIGRWIVRGIGYGPAFLILSSFALGSILLWIGFASTLKPACAEAADDGNKVITPAREGRCLAGERYLEHSTRPQPQREAELATTPSPPPLLPPGP